MPYIYKATITIDHDSIHKDSRIHNINKEYSLSNLNI